MLTRFSRTSLLVVVMVAATAPSWAAQFTADVFSNRKRGDAMVMQGTVYVDGDKVRLDVRSNQNVAVLVQGAGKPAVYLDYTRKIYRELPERPGIAMSESALKNLGAVKTIGTAKVNGHDCRKVQCVFREKDQGTQTAYFAKDLGIPMKIEQQRGGDTVTVELRNIKKTSVPASKFAIPTGFKKLRNIPPPPRKKIMAPIPKPKL